MAEEVESDLLEFYGTECGHCKKVEPLIGRLETETNLKGGTFTITNIGVIGGIRATPIINYPETAILATGRIYEKAVVRDGHVTIRKVMPLSLSFDHRVIDGAMAARFVNAIIRYLEDPDLLLLEGD
jgi:pyruvate dehydrogenase E2 component (dihydrolipoamide acetyltransferase)